MKHCLVSLIMTVGLLEAAAETWYIPATGDVTRVLEADTVTGGIQCSADVDWIVFGSHNERRYYAGEGRGYRYSCKQNVEIMPNESFHVRTGVITYSYTYQAEVKRTCTVVQDGHEVSVTLNPIDIGAEGNSGLAMVTPDSCVPWTIDSEDWIEWSHTNGIGVGSEQYIAQPNILCRDRQSQCIIAEQEFVLRQEGHLSYEDINGEVISPIQIKYGLFDNEILYVDGGILLSADKSGGWYT